MTPNDSDSLTLRYRFDALEPTLSANTVLHHLFQHQRDCYERTVVLMREAKLRASSLDSLVRLSAVDPRNTELFELASEVWNHELYWCSLHPRGGGPAWGLIGEGIRRCFGTFGRFSRCTEAAAESVFGPGWLWVTWHAGKIELLVGGSRDLPILHGRLALLAIDLWEHAYYLDYYSARGAYVRACLTNLIDWTYGNLRLLSGARSNTSKIALRWLGCGLPPSRPSLMKAGAKDMSVQPPRARDGLSPKDHRKTPSEVRHE
ncbi:MAG TPA: superoxide dismutase [Steroidobacteraceae bacterium]|nr:superoxide dismutase [Steroidobacteraceae bacterium]